MNAAPDRSALMQQAAEERAKTLKRAVADVVGGLDEEHSLRSVSLNRGVPEGALREALHAAGWVAPNRVRQNNSRSRAKQLPHPRSDNQP